MDWRRQFKVGSGAAGRHGRVKAMGELRITDVAVDVIRWPRKIERRHGVGDIAQWLPGAILRLAAISGICG
jgi:hypothetical protein